MANPALRLGPITWLYKAGVSWGYYVGEGTCVARRASISKASSRRRCRIRCPGSPPRPRPASSTTSGRTRSSSATRNGDLPSVSWFMPEQDKGEHPPDSIEVGQAYVAKAINAVMEGPEEQWMRTRSSSPGTTGAGSTTTCCHRSSTRTDGAARALDGDQPVGEPGFIDSQTLSYDAYLKLIEDRFLGGQRLDPESDGWPDSRPTVREEVKPRRPGSGLRLHPGAPAPARARSLAVPRLSRLARRSRCGGSPRTPGRLRSRDGSIERFPARWSPAAVLILVGAVAVARERRCRPAGRCLERPDLAVARSSALGRNRRARSPPVPRARPLPDRARARRSESTDARCETHRAPAGCRPVPPVRSGGGHHEPGSPRVRRAGEPVVRPLLRHVPGRRRHPDGRRGSQRLPARPDPRHVIVPPRSQPVRLRGAPRRVRLRDLDRRRSYERVRPRVPHQGQRL